MRTFIGLFIFLALGALAGCLDLIWHVENKGIYYIIGTMSALIALTIMKD